MIVRSSGIRVLGAPIVRSPLVTRKGGALPAFVSDDARVLSEIELPRRVISGTPSTFERAGPREKIFFEPGTLTAAVLTAGGVCPGINDVIRSLVLELCYGYGVPRILGIRYGYAGLDPARSLAPIELSPALVHDVHMRGGTFLGTSRGICETARIVDDLVRQRIDVLFTVGGDGTMRAAHALHEEITSRGLSIGVVGVPKTIDNDIPFVDKTFGFDTAVATARSAIDAAHAEATSFERGVGLVRLMGRHAGFIAANATLASHDVNACLIPELGFDLEGECGFLAWLERRLADRGHAVVVVAEGCAKHLAGPRFELDASGNVRFGAESGDVGRFLRLAIESHFAKQKRAVAMKYIDPSYMVRALRASAEDAVFCDALARNAVHAALAGKTDMVVGRWHRHFTHVSLTDLLAHEKRVEPEGELWRQVLEATGQPTFRGEARSELTART
jgi:6-phosphofructokinase 1